MVTGPVQAAAPAHRCHCAHQLCQSSAGIALLVQGHAKGVLEAGRGHNEVLWAERELETGHS